MIKKEKLTRSEEDLMEIFWEAERPLTSIQLVELGEDHAWKSSYIHIMLKSLEKKEMITICGAIQYGTQYARQFQPLLTREEYAARVAISTGISEDSIAQVTIAMAKQAGNEENLISELEKIIQELKKK